jgi:uncharacterized protein
VAHLRATFALDWHGIHGAPHWARVHQNGLLLAERHGADVRVITLFAYLHDHLRRDDGRDAEHGARAAASVGPLGERLSLGLDASQVRLLEQACLGHSHGHMEGDITVRCCWDADRLDLGRVGIRPDPERLCTPAARDPAVLAAAYARSRRGRGA